MDGNAEMLKSLCNLTALVLGGAFILAVIISFITGNFDKKREENEKFLKLTRRDEP